MSVRPLLLWVLLGFLDGGLTGCGSSDNQEGFHHKNICFTVLAPCLSRQDAYKPICEMTLGMVSVDSEPVAKAPPDEDGTQSCCYDYTDWYSPTNSPPPTGKVCTEILAPSHP